MVQGSRSLIDKNNVVAPENRRVKHDVGITIVWPTKIREE